MPTVEAVPTRRRTVIDELLRWEANAGGSANSDTGNTVCLLAWFKAAIKTCPVVVSGEPDAMKGGVGLRAV